MHDVTPAMATDAALSTATADEFISSAVALPNSAHKRKVFESILLEEKVGGTTFMELNSIEAIKQCVLRGIGAAMLPMMAVKQEIKQKKLVVLPWPEERLETAILMIRHKGKWLSPALQYFMDTVREVLNPDVATVG